MQGLNRIKEAAHVGKQERGFSGLFDRYQAFDIPGKFVAAAGHAAFRERPRSDVENHPRDAGACKARRYDPDADSIGLQAASALGVAPNRMLKTLMAEVDGKAVCAVVPSDREVSMKKLASAFGGKAAKMMRPADAERLTGYHVGGISPFGQKKRVPVALEESALGEARVFVNGGQRGLQIELDPNEAVKALGAITRPLTA